MNHSMYAALLFAMLSGMQPEAPTTPDASVHPQSQKAPTAVLQDTPRPEEVKKIPAQK